MEEERKQRLEEEARREAEAEAMRVAEERAQREKENKEAKLQQEAQEAYGIIGDLDNALKAFQGALGLSDVSLLYMYTYTYGLN